MGHEHDPTPIQPGLGEKITIFYLVPISTCIWPDKTGMGVVQEEFAADKIGQKINGLSGYRTRTTVKLYRDEHFWSLPQGALFGAYSKNLRRRTIK